MSSSKEKLAVPSSSSTLLHQHRNVFLEISSFCIFNSTLGPKEGQEEQKILYFYPLEVDRNSRIRHIGLLEGVIKFMSSFSDNDCRSMLTSKYLYVLSQPEKDFWIAMTLKVLRQPLPEGASDDNERTRNEQPQDAIYRGILESSYRIYRLMYGTLEDRHSIMGVLALQKGLSRFYNEYLSKLVLGPHDALHRFDSMAHLPMDRKMYLEVQSWMNQTLINFREIKHALVTFGNFIVWNDLNLAEARTVADYISKFVQPDLLEKDMSLIHSTTSTTSHFSSQGHLGRFHVGPSNLWAPDAVYKPESAYLTSKEGDTMEEYIFSIYSASGLTATLFLEVGPATSSMEFCRKLDMFLGPTMTVVAAGLAEHCSKLRNPSIWTSEYPVLHYVYINETSLSRKQTIADRNQSVQPEILKALAAVDEDLVCRPDDAEIFSKVFHDCWIYGRRSLGRRLLVVLTQRNADLEMAEDEIRKMCAREFSGMHDASLAW